MPKTGFQRFLEFSDRMPRWLTSVILVGSLACIGWADHVAGWEWSLFVFYAIPIMLGVWWGGRTVGLILAIISTAVWWLAHVDSQPHQGMMGYLFATISRLAYFTLAALGASTFKAKQESDAARIQALEEMRQLEREIVGVSEYEQQRIGQDLHDGLCQQLAAIGCAARALADDLEARSIPEAKDAESIELALQTAVSEARSLARGIFPVHVDRTGLSTALSELAETTSRMAGIPIEVAEWSEVHVADPEVAMHLYRIAQEAVSNAVKHSNAEEITITLRAMGDVLELRVEDDGKGLPRRAAGTAPGMGLKTMRYRAQALGAELEIEPRPEGGTSISCLMKVRTIHGDHPDII